jgi:hypothetical protein
MNLNELRGCTHDLKLKVRDGDVEPMMAAFRKIL